MPAIDLSQWLNANPVVRKSIKWNDKYNGYHVIEASKVMYDNWTTEQKQYLNSEYNAVWEVFSNKSPLVDSIVYPPKNINVSQVDGNYPLVRVTKEYAWQLYIKWIAFNLYADIYKIFPWRFSMYKDPMRQVFFDSSCMSICDPNKQYIVGALSVTSTALIYPEDNLGASLIAPPLYTYDFLVKNNMIGKTTSETVVNLLKWISANFAHFEGNLTYKRTEEIWQYRGLPPITSIIKGTTDTANKTFAHWTFGCHGTGGFLINVLRAANIPVQIIRICGHAVIYFMYDGMYMDHGDDPYSSAFKKSGAGVNHLFITEATYVKWFGNNHNNHDGVDTPGCDCSKVGYAAQFPNHS